MPAITNDWAEYLKPEYKKPYYKKLFDFVGQAYATETVYPPMIYSTHFTQRRYPM